jgi:small-conductance mechanosensitive channel
VAAGLRLPGSFREVWNFQLLDLNGTQITVATLMIAAVVLLLGVTLSRLLSRALAGLLKRRTKAHPGAVTAAQSLLFYALCALVVLLAMKVAKVPLSIFAVAGGALAIGVGFGSQNILNNFISGVILLIERPIRVGDIVQLEGPHTVNGVVRDIGARSTRIVTGENVEIVVPNSTLLQHNVVNWTLSSDEIRANISVGVAYGTPLQQARDLLLDAAANHGLVLKSPAPVVLCEEFGENAVILRLYFWMRVRRAFERRTVESDLRFKTESLFRKAGLVIAFPQRDVHLSAHAPIAVRIAGDAGNPTSPEPRTPREVVAHDQPVKP